MARLPNPGSDAGQWGEILNEFLRVTHTNDGTLRPGIVGSSHVANGAVTEDKLAVAVRNKLDAATSGSDGADGREIELGTSATHVQWRYLGDPTWVDLVALADITGPQGAKGDKGDTGSGGASSITSSYPALERLRTLRAFGAGTMRVAVVGDSTGNDGTEWVRLWSQKYGAQLPESMRRTYKAWNNTTSTWGAEIVDAGGTPGVLDTFTRTGQVAGSSPDIGPSWLAFGTGWNADGSKAVMTPGSTGSFGTDLGGSDGTAIVDLLIVTTAQTPSQAFRVYLGSPGHGGGGGVWLALTISTSGGLSGSLHKTVSGTTTTLDPSKTVAGQVTNSATSLAVKATVTWSGTTVTASTVVAGQTTSWSATLSPGDPALFGTWLALTAHNIPPVAPFGFEIDRVEASSGIKANRFEVWNGSIAGATPATFNQTLLNSQFGGNLFDLVILNFGHNGSQSGAQFVATISGWLDGWLTDHSESSVLLMSQNPQKAPSAGIAGHAARLAALRIWAAEQGYPYVPVWETFRQQPGSGESLILSDGVHPTSPPSGTTTGDYGSVLWADTVVSATS